ncbi:hypothetical protein YPPY92_1223, partial [Yersinia pestis PY-92]
MTTPRC